MSPAFRAGPAWPLFRAGSIWRSSPCPSPPWLERSRTAGPRVCHRSWWSPLGLQNAASGGADAQRGAGPYWHTSRACAWWGPTVRGHQHQSRRVDERHVRERGAAPGSVGFASQSGGLGIAILGEASSRGLGLSSFVSMGNKADISGNDLLQWWEQDDATQVIFLYLESFGNPRKFGQIARRGGGPSPLSP